MACSYPQAAIVKMHTGSVRRQQHFYRVSTDFFPAASIRGRPSSSLVSEDTFSQQQMYRAPLLLPTSQDQKSSIAKKANQSGTFEKKAQRPPCQTEQGQQNKLSGA